MAEVADKSPSGFQVRHTTPIAGTREKVFQSLTEVGKWWDSAHTYSGDARNMSIEARPGGCFCERLSNGGGVQHMTVVFVAPNEMLRMTGGLGPLQGAGVAGSMTFTLAQSSNGGTQLTLAYSVGGYYTGGLDTLAGAVDGMLGEQIARLKTYVEQGSPSR